MPRYPQSASRLAARGSRHKRAESSQVAAGAPRMPAWLPRRAKDVWRTCIRQSKSVGLLAPIDAALLTSFVLAVVEVENTTKTIDAEGLTIESHGQRYSHPLLKVRANAQQRVRAIASELGFAPAARKRMNVEMTDGKPEVDPLAKFKLNNDDDDFLKPVG